MMRTLAVVRKILAVGAAIALLLVVLLGVAWWSIRTNWFANLVRARVVSILRKTTGGRVELGQLVIDPDKFSVSVSRLVVHGTEPSSGPPLLTVESADIGLKILSVLQRDIDVSSIAIVHPEIHVVINPNGTTNIPRFHRVRSDENPIEQLFELKVKRLEVTRGLAQVNDRKLPFAFTSKDIRAGLTYDLNGPSYGVSFQAGDLSYASPKRNLASVSLSAAGRLFQNRADIQQLKVATRQDASTIEFEGVLKDFAHPSGDALIRANVSMDEVATFGLIHDQLRYGRGTVAGSLQLRSSGQFEFKGKASAQGVDFHLPGFDLPQIAASADLLANNDGIILRNAQGEARGARFSGQGTIRNYHLLQVEGRVSNVALREVGAYLTNRPFPWSGTAHGTAHASASLADKDPHFLIGARVDVDAGTSGIPTYGNVDVTYDDSADIIEFGDSTLHLPSSTLEFHGALNSDLFLDADSSNLADVQPIIPILGGGLETPELPGVLPGGEAHFDGLLHNPMQQRSISGNLSLAKFRYHHYDLTSLAANLTLASDELEVHQFRVQQAAATISGSGSAHLDNGALTDRTPLRLSAQFGELNIVNTAALLNIRLPAIQGFASGDINLQGTLQNPQGSASVRIRSIDAYGEQLNQVSFKAALASDKLEFQNGRVQSGVATLAFSGFFSHSPSDWSTGDLSLKADTNGFPLASLAIVRKYAPALNGRAEIHLNAFGKLQRTSFEPLKMDGRALLTRITVDGRDFGGVSLDAVTQAQTIRFAYSGSLLKTDVNGSADAQLVAGTPIRGNMQVKRVALSTLKSLVSQTVVDLPVDGYLAGNVVFDGLLEEPARVHAQAALNELEIRSTRPTVAAPDLMLRNTQPVVLDLSNGVVDISRFEVAGHETAVKLSGSVPLWGGRRDAQSVNVKAVGRADLALFGMFDPNVRSSGTGEIDASITGTLTAPKMTAVLRVHNGSFFLDNVSNGLSEVNGVVVFMPNRATIQSMTAHSGGGDISLGGSLNFGLGSPLVYHLEAAARNVRVRYANSISVTANSDLRLSGTSASSLLSGTLTVNRVVFTPNADAGNLLAAASSSNAAQPEQGDFLSGLHLDVAVESAPNLQVSTNLSRDVEAEIELRMRGTPDHPIVLGNITANQGDLKIFGTRFSLNRGEVSFVNTIRIEPILDLDLETQARGVTVDITVSGTPSKLNFNYRSDPPLQPRDIIALLTVGRTPDVGTVSNVQNGHDIGALSSGVNTVLGQAISPVSNRLSKLFGIANIKIDPFVQGITNTPQARLSVEQQISKDVTVTYVTNLSQTSEQIFRFEWAFSRQFSVVAIRDDNGEFGIDFQYKKRFK